VSDARPVLVTGATGFFGGNLARALAERGAHVRVLVRGGRRPVALEGFEYEIVDGDLCDERAVALAVRGCRHVYHAAAQLVFWCANAKAREAVWRVNVDGTRAVLRAAGAAGVDRVLHVSTVDAIDVAAPGEIADETTDWPPGRLDNPYAASKREAEALARQAGVWTVVVNPAFMIGPYDVKPSSGRLLLPLARGPLVGYPVRGGTCCVDVRDAVAGALAAIERGRRGERYILGGENLTYRALFARALAVLGRRPLNVPISSGAARVAGRVFDLFGRITGREPLFPSTLARAAFMDHYYSSAKAVRELGYPQTPIEQALRDAFAWYRQSRM
jgi:dihydroflavonol-4-reductase